VDGVTFALWLLYNVIVRSRDGITWSKCCDATPVESISDTREVIDSTLKTFSNIAKWLADARFFVQTP
jgi:hypothetical protein